MTTTTLVSTVPPHLAGRRFDQVLAVLFPDYSRARLQRWIRDGLATLDARRVRPRERVAGGERVELRPLTATEVPWSAEHIPLCVVHEDHDLIAVDKPAGLVVHPGAGNPRGTLVNALLDRAPELAAIPRAGIVHRLDKNTSGLLLIARSLRAHARLVEDLRLRAITREYDAVVVGRVTGSGTVDAPIGRHPGQRTRMAAVASGRRAVTHYRIVERFERFTHLRLKLDTGRTHQIRVHMRHIGHSLVGDPEYGRRGAADFGLRRQALHASRLALRHPISGAAMQLLCALPPDLAQLLARLREPGSDDR